jgi:hypothetical protein
MHGVELKGLWNGNGSACKHADLLEMQFSSGDFAESPDNM